MHLIRDNACHLYINLCKKWFCYYILSISYVLKSLDKRIKNKIKAFSEICFGKQTNKKKHDKEKTQSP